MDISRYQREIEKQDRLAKEMPIKRILGAAGSLQHRTARVWELVEEHAFEGKPLDKVEMRKRLGKVLRMVSRMATENQIRLGELAAMDLKDLKEAGRIL